MEKKKKHKKTHLENINQLLDTVGGNLGSLLNFIESGQPDLTEYGIKDAQGSLHLLPGGLKWL